MKSSISLFSFVGSAFALVSKMSSWNPGSCTFSLCYLLEGFTASHLAVNSMINFKLTFVECVRAVSRLIFCCFCKCFCCSVSGCPYFRIILFPLGCLCSLIKDQLHVFMWIYFWALMLLICVLALFSYLILIKKYINFIDLLISLFPFSVALISDTNFIFFFLFALDLICSSF